MARFFGTSSLNTMLRPVARTNTTTNAIVAAVRGERKSIPAKSGSSSVASVGSAMAPSTRDVTVIPS